MIFWRQTHHSFIYGKKNRSILEWTAVTLCVFCGEIKNNRSNNNAAGDVDDGKETQAEELIFN